jgi:hypothetical protein
MANGSKTLASLLATVIKTAEAAEFKERTLGTQGDVAVIEVAPFRGHKMLAVRGADGKDILRISARKAQKIVALGDLLTKAAAEVLKS